MLGAWLAHGMSMANACEEHGRSVAGAGQTHGKSMAGAWQEHGRSMARAWQEHGSTAHAQYAWSAGCGIACPSHYILRSPKETTNFETPGVAFGTMTVAVPRGARGARFVKEF